MDEAGLFHESVEEGKRTLDKGRRRREGGREDVLGVNNKRGSSVGRVCMGRR